MNSFTVSTWNLENLFRNGHEFGPPSPDDYQAKLDNLALIIADSGGETLFACISGQKELIDHILVSENLLPGQSRRTPKVDSGVDFKSLPSITDNPDERRGQPGSDHAAITAVFELR